MSDFKHIYILKKQIAQQGVFIIYISIFKLTYSIYYFFDIDHIFVIEIAILNYT